MFFSLDWPVTKSQILNTEGSSCYVVTCFCEFFFAGSIYIYGNFIGKEKIFSGFFREPDLKHQVQVRLGSAPTGSDPA